MAKRIAILTGGGHIASFHAGMFGVCEEAAKRGYEVIGFRDGYKGTVSDSWLPLSVDVLEPNKAGSLLGSSREKADPQAVREVVKKHDLAALIVMGGNDHLGEADLLAREGLPLVGWPKTMDNDLSKTYFTLGFPTTAMHGARMVREAHADAITNSRVHLVTVFGRTTDWAAAAVGVWGCADVLVPSEKYLEGVDEQRYDIREIFERVEEAVDANAKLYGRRFAVVVVAEGADIDGLASHLNEDEIDVHGNPKIEPMKLAVTLKQAFREIGGKKYPIAIDAASYILRNTSPIEVDRRLSEAAGRACVKAIDDGAIGVSSVVTCKDGQLGVDVAPLSEVSPQRFMRPEKLYDYENMAVLPAFAEHYEPAFGPPPTKDSCVYKPMVR